MMLLLAILAAAPPPPSTVGVRMRQNGVDAGIARTLNMVGSTVNCVIDVCTVTTTGGSSDAGSGGAPTTAQYWVGAADGTLSAEKNLGALGTGLVVNTAGTPSAYAGATCGANQYATQTSASGALTCSQVATTQLSGTITNAQLASSYSGVGTCTNQFARVLNTNAAPTCATVALGTDTSGSYYNTVQDEGTPLTQRSTLNFVGGSITCADTGGVTVCTISGGGGGLSYAEVAAAVMGGF